MTINENDIKKLMDEMKMGLEDKTRTIDQVSNSRVKEIISKEAETLLNSGEGEHMSIVLGAASGTLAGAGALAGGGIAVGAIKAANKDNSGSNAVTGIAKVACVALAALAGYAIGKMSDKSEKQRNDKKIIEYQEMLRKLTECQSDLEKEVEELKEKYSETAEENARLKYLLQLLMVNKNISEAIESILKKWETSYEKSTIN